MYDPDYFDDDLYEPINKLRKEIIFLEKKLAEYKQLETDGRLIVIPSIPYNKTLYWLWDGKIVRFKYRGINGGCVTSQGFMVTCKMVLVEDVTINGYLIKAGNERWFYHVNIGETIFFIRKEAEAKLKTKGE